MLFPILWDFSRDKGSVGETVLLDLSASLTRDCELTTASACSFTNQPASQQVSTSTTKPLSYHHFILRQPPPLLLVLLLVRAGAPTVAAASARAVLHADS
jgi:hypothetical protein